MLGRRRAGERDLDAAQTELECKRQAAAVIGIAGAIGAFGGFLIQVAFRQASLSTAALIKAAHTPAQAAAIAHAHPDWSIPALWAFLAAYVALGALTWLCYLRRSVAQRVAPGLAHASI